MIKAVELFREKLYPKKKKAGDNMTYNKEYRLNYAKEKLKRIPLDLRKEEYERIKQHCDKLEIPVNTFIKELINRELNKGI